MRKGIKGKQKTFGHQFFSQIGPALKEISNDDFNGCLVYTYFQKKLINLIFLHKFFRHELFPLAIFSCAVRNKINRVLLGYKTFAKTYMYLTWLSTLR